LANIAKDPLGKHEAKFIPREVVQDYKDRLYHGKPEFNHKGIPYRPVNPSKIHRLHTVAIMPAQPVTDWLLRELAEDFFRQHGRLPAACTFPGVGNRRWRGLTVPGAGQVLLELIPCEGEFNPFVHDEEAQA
jgi:hypothetical protein